MPVETQLEILFEVLEGGRAIAPAEIVQFPVDAGATALEGITETVEIGNGVATEVSQLTAVEGGATTTAGVGILGMEVGAVGAAIAPALGLVAGVGLYNLSPDFWRKVSNTLIHEGETINGMVRAFLNSNDKTIGFTEQTIEIFKNAYLEEGLYDPITEFPEPIIEEHAEYTVTSYGTLGACFNSIFSFYSGFYDITAIKNDLAAFIGTFKDYPFVLNFYVSATSQIEGYSPFTIQVLPKTITGETGRVGDTISTGLSNNLFETYGYGGPDGIKLENFNIRTISNVRIDAVGKTIFESDTHNELYYTSINTTYEPSDNIQPDATTPEIAVPIPATYPDWSTRSYELPDEHTKIYPLTMPVIDPAPLQAPAQNPQPLPDNDPALLDWLIDAMNLPQADPAIEPAPLPAIDPDPQPTGDPINEPTKPNTKPDPIEPNPEPTTPFLPVVPTLPDSVPANAMFTVYKPTIAQVDAFGGWLWSNSILETIKRIWQNPLDGIIAFMKVYVDAPTSGNDTIKVGVLDSEVTSAVVSGQFVTVECGSIDIEEKFFNATDYSPFVALHLYLPFIGIVELDIDEFMGGSIKVTYHVDVYTGTCLAEVKAKRNHDMDDYTIVYTFSGNASQQLPLTSAEFGGALSALVGVVGGGLAIASGGGLGLLAGASGIAHAVTHEMVHLAHSGSLSANAGIMGARTPYLILTRRRGYDANGYNQIYGYPANKTVYLNNCSGLVRVKDIQLKTGATDLEASEIVSLLKEGVII